MEDRELDRKISEALRKGTGEAVALQEQVWQNICDNIGLEGVKEDKSQLESVKDNKSGLNIQDSEGRWSLPENKGSFVRGKKRPGLLAWASVAAAIAMTLFVGTEPGQAAFKKIKQIFLPEKQIVQELEGQKEKARVSLHENKEANYVIYVDKERYKIEKSKGKDRIVPLIRPTGDYPEVFMEISQVQDKLPDQLAAEIEKQLKDEYPIVRDTVQVDDPVQGIFLSALSGQNHNSKIVRYYLVENKLGGSFVIRQQLFLEAEEGHGARFNNMLKEFRIVLPESQ